MWNLVNLTIFFVRVSKLKKKKHWFHEIFSFVIVWWSTTCSRRKAFCKLVLLWPGGIGTALLLILQFSKLLLCCYSQTLIWWTWCLPKTTIRSSLTLESIPAGESLEVTSHRYTPADERLTLRNVTLFTLHLSSWKRNENCYLIIYMLSR